MEEKVCNPINFGLANAKWQIFFSLKNEPKHKCKNDDRKSKIGIFFPGLIIKIIIHIF